MRTRERVLEGLLLLVVFVLGFEVFPALHLADHAHTHDHVIGVASADALASAPDADVLEVAPHTHTHGAFDPSHHGVLTLPASIVLPEVPEARISGLCAEEAALTTRSECTTPSGRSRAPPHL